MAAVDGEDDVDGDGWEAPDDCDDTRDEVYPGAVEVAYDGVDQDCDGSDLVDVDGDGWVGRAVGGDDCDDAAADVNPAGDEVCGDLRDGDCDGTVDEGCAAEVGSPETEGFAWVCGPPGVEPAGWAVLAAVLVWTRRRRA